MGIHRGDLRVIKSMIISHPGINREKRVNGIARASYSVGNEAESSSYEVDFPCQESGKS